MQHERGGRNEAKERAMQQGIGVSPRRQPSSRTDSGQQTFKLTGDADNIVTESQSKKTARQLAIYRHTHKNIRGRQAGQDRKADKARREALMDIK